MTIHAPTLETERLILRPFSNLDARRIQELAGDERVYATTLNVPHPYDDGLAENWIATHATQFARGEGVTLAITLRSCGTLIGAISLGASKLHRRAELGYWLGMSYWGVGYGTEAARALIQYGFESLGCHKISARHFASNPASGRVLDKAGMHKEGELRDEVLKDGVFHNLIVYGIVNYGK